jgi:hypothetical protein
MMIILPSFTFQSRFRVLNGIRPNSKLPMPFQPSDIRWHITLLTTAITSGSQKIEKEAMTMVKSYLLLALAVLLHSESAMATQELTMKSFGELKKSGKNGIVKFFQTWCGQ